MFMSRKCAARLFQTRGPAAAKLLSPNVLWVRTSRTYRDQVYVVSQARRCLAGRRREDKARQFKVHSSPDWKTVQQAQHW